MGGLERTIDVFVASGQSLCMAGGTAKLPRGERAVSTSPPDPERLFMLDTGVIVRLGKRAEAAPGRLVPIREKASRGESQGTAMLRLAARLDPDGGPLAYLLHGKGGAAIGELGPGTPSFRFGEDQLRALTRIAVASGRRVRVVAAPFTQGEADRKEGTSRASYRSTLTAYAEAVDRSFRAITGQVEPVRVFVDQLAASMDGAGPSDVALAQLDAAERGAVIMTGPRYHFRDGYGILDNVHLRPLGYALLGEYHAKAEARARQGRPTALRPVRDSFRRDGREVSFRLEGAVGGAMVGDELPILRHLGFEWLPGSGSGGVDEVHVDGDRIAIRVRGCGPGTLRYACAPHDGIVGRPSAWGNIHDRDDVESLAVPGVRLRNWLVAFEADIG